MSALYTFKVNSAQAIKLSPVDVIKYCYNSMENNFRYDIKSFEIDGKNEPKKIDGERFVQLMENLVKEKGLKVDDLKKHLSEYWLGDVERVEESYKSKKIHEIPGYKGLMWSTLFSHITKQPANDILRVSLEVVSTHPDAGFPTFRVNAATTQNDERKFLLRLLGDIEDKARGLNNPIKRFFSDNGGDHVLLEMPEGGIRNTAEIVWGFERHKGTKLSPASSTFSKKYKDSWWISLFENTKENSSNKPYEVTVYDVYLHPVWFPGIEEFVGKTFESAAYW